MSASNTMHTLSKSCSLSSALMLAILRNLDAESESDVTRVLPLREAYEAGERSITRGTRRRVLLS